MNVGTGIALILVGVGLASLGARRGRSRDALLLYAATAA
jgi:hypothetical protein